MKKVINFAVIGSGFIVDRFCKAASMLDNLQLHTFYSRNIDTANAFKNKYNFIKATTSLTDIASDNEIDAIYIASPNAIHHDQAILFLNNKKHILCEKSFASNYKEALNMINIAKENNVIIMEAMRITTLPNFNNVKANLHKIGKIRRYFASYCQYSSRYDKFKEGTILNAFKIELSNGSLMDIGVYCLSPLINLFGLPKDVICNSYFLSTGVDGQGSVILDYDDMDAIIMYSKISNSNIPSEIQGEKGSIVIDKLSNFNTVKIIYNDGTIEDISTSQYQNDIYYVMKEFVDLALKHPSRSNYTSINPPENTLNVMFTMDNIRKKINLFYPADNNI